MSDWREIVERSAMSVASQTSVVAMTFWIGLLMLAFIPPTGVLNGNEEYYFQLAYKFLHPEFPSPESSIMGSRPHMLIFLYPVGHLIDWVGFEAVQILTRLLVAACYTVVLVRFFRALKFRAIDAVGVLLVFFLLGQQILGGEWLFDGAEAKSFAYPLIILAIAAAIEGKLVQTSVACAVATYFHFLVGGFWFGALWLCLLLTVEPKRQMVTFSALYVVLTLPLMYIVLSSYGPALASPPSDTDLPPIAWITGIFRNGSLTAPFSSVWQLLTWSPRIGLLFGLWIVSAWYLRVTDRGFAFMARLVVVALTYLVAVLGLSLVLTMIGKDYMLAAMFPFRPSSLALFLWLIVGLHAARHLLTGERAEFRVLLAVVVVCGAVAVPVVADRSIVNVIRDQRQDVRQAGLNAFIDSETGPSEVFVVHPSLEGEFWKFERERKQPIYSFRKFTSVDKNVVYEWYERERIRERISRSGCGPDAAPRADYLIVPANFDSGHVGTCGNVVYSDNNYLLIELI